MTKLKFKFFILSRILLSVQFWFGGSFIVRVTTWLAASRCSRCLVQLFLVNGLRIKGLQWLGSPLYGYIYISGDGFRMELGTLVAMCCFNPQCADISHDLQFNISQFELKPLSHSTAIPWRWHGDLKFLRAPWDRTKILKNIANNFTFYWLKFCRRHFQCIFLKDNLGILLKLHGNLFLRV